MEHGDDYVDAKPSAGNNDARERLTPTSAKSGQTVEGKGRAGISTSKPQLSERLGEEKSYE